jgi:hypothetical protein
LNFYSWKDRTLQQVINLGEEGTTPLEVRFLHEPTSNIGYVGCAMHSTVYKFQKKEDGTWTANKVIKVPPKKVEGWITPHMSGNNLLFFFSSSFSSFPPFLPHLDNSCQRRVIPFDDKIFLNFDNLMKSFDFQYSIAPFNGWNNKEVTYHDVCCFMLALLEY